MRDVDSLKGLHAVRTMQSSKKRSIPRIQSSAYLDLFMLQKEKDRLIKENERLLMKMEQTNKRLVEIDIDINKLQETEITTTQAKTDTGFKKYDFTQSTQKQGEKKKKEWKKMSLNY